MLPVHPPDLARELLHDGRPGAGRRGGGRRCARSGPVDSARGSTDGRRPSAMAPPAPRTRPRRRPPPGARLVDRQPAAAAEVDAVLWKTRALPGGPERLRDGRVRSEGHGVVSGRPEPVASGVPLAEALGGARRGLCSKVEHDGTVDDPRSDSSERCRSAACARDQGSSAVARRRRGAGHARRAAARCALRRSRRAGDHPGRERLGQGGRRPRAPREQPAAADEALRRRQRGGAARRAARVRALRPRARRVHGGGDARRPGCSRRPTGDALPRRDRRDAAAAAGEAPARAPGRRGAPRRRTRAFASTCGSSCATHRDLRGARRARAVPRGSATSASRC